MKKYLFWIIIITFIILLIICIYLSNFSVLPINGGKSVITEEMLNELKNNETNQNYKLAAVIVEPRENNIIETINHYLKSLPEYTHFQVYHGIDNEELIRKNFDKLIKDNKISLFNLKVKNLNLTSYSHLLTSIEFWKTIKSNNVLIFQTDSITCSSSNKNIEDLYEYDFIGAPTTDLVNKFLYIYFILNGINLEYKNYMNGGLSFRKKVKCIECLEKFPWNGRSTEDVWFVSSLYRMDTSVNLPTMEIAKKYFYESGNIDRTPWGVHKPRTSKEILNNLYDICEEAKTIPVVEPHTDYSNLFIF
jgi:hypothetical protein